jgi:glutamine synthetase
MNIADQHELDDFLHAHPDVQMLELLFPDVNGILRCKRLHRREFSTLFEGQYKLPMSVPFLGILGDLYTGNDDSLFRGDPDILMLPLSGTLALVPWLGSPTAQVMVGFAGLDGQPAWVDSRNVLARVVNKLAGQGLGPVVATELEFYLLGEGENGQPAPLRGKITGTGGLQEGIQYCMADDLFDCDAYLNDVRIACDAQGVPFTAVHSEFSPGQWEINTHHVSDPLLACDHAMLLKRIVKGVARRHGMAATFLSKPFADIAGSGLHIHASLYGEDGENVFAAAQQQNPPLISDKLRHAIGGLYQTMPEACAIFAPNPNAYRRLRPGAYAPWRPSWGYDHREVALRIPVSSEHNRRVEHRVAGADANPYLTTAAVLAGMHYGIRERCEPGPETETGGELVTGEVRLPRHWHAALELFRTSRMLPEYFGEDYCRTFAVTRQGECDAYQARIPNLDYEWYLRAL